MDELLNRFEIAKKIALEAGALALDYFYRRDALVIENKRHITDLVSEADREVEILIRGALRNAFPHDGQLGEEHGLEEGTSGYLWVIDPIDGTAPFLSGLPGWCVSVGLNNGKDNVLGAIFAPVLGEIFSGGRGLGAFVNDRPVSAIKGDLRAAMVGFGMNDRIPLKSAMELISDLSEAGVNWSRYGSGALMLAFVGAGRLSGYCEPRMSLWDCSAGYAIVEGAGGRVRPFPLGEDPSKPAPVLAAGPNAFEELTAIAAFSSTRYE